MGVGAAPRHELLLRRSPRAGWFGVVSSVSLFPLQLPPSRPISPYLPTSPHISPSRRGRRAARPSACACSCAPRPTGCSSRWAAARCAAWRPPTARRCARARGGPCACTTRGGTQAILTLPLPLHLPLTRTLPLTLPSILTLTRAERVARRRAAGGRRAAARLPADCALALRLRRAQRPQLRDARRETRRAPLPPI